MSIVVPRRLLTFEMSDRRKAVLAVALSHRGDASVRQMRSILHVSQKTLFKELDALVADGLVTRDRGRSSSFGIERRSGRCNGRLLTVSAALAGEGSVAVPTAVYADATTASNLWLAVEGYISRSTSTSEGS